MSSIYLRNGVWQIKYRRPGATTFTQRSLKTTNKREAQAAQRKIDAALAGSPLTTIHQPPATKIPSPTLSALLAKYTADAPTYHDPLTIDSRTRALRRLIAYTSAETTAAEITLPAALDYQQRYAATRIRRGKRPTEGPDTRPAHPIANRSINEAITALASVWALAARLQWIPTENPWQKVPTLKETRRAIHWYDGPTRAKFFEAARLHSENALLLFALALGTGLRKNECINARWEWIDFNNRTLTLRATPDFKIKGRAERTIPLSLELCALLEPCRRPAGYILEPTKEKGRWKYRWDPRKTFAAVVSAAGVPRARIHELRHTYAAAYLAAGGDIFRLARWLGHSTVRTTELYGHLKPDDRDIDRVQLLA